MSDNVAFDVETEVTEEQFYKIGEKIALVELADLIEDEDTDEAAELQGDATQRFNRATRPMAV